MPFPDRSSHIINFKKLVNNTLSRHVFVKFLEVGTGICGLVLHYTLHIHRSEADYIVTPSTFVVPIIVSGVLLVSHMLGCWPDRKLVMMYNVCVGVLYCWTLNTLMGELSPADKYTPSVWNHIIMKSIASAFGLLLEILEFILELVVYNMQKITPVVYFRR